MQIKGITFVGTRTSARSETGAFVRDVLGLTPLRTTGMDAEVFALPDGSTFAVTSPDGPDDSERTIGFLVEDIAQAADELRAAGVETDDEIAESATQRYLHFRAPDGHLYELVENKRWSTKEDIAAALAALEEAIPGWTRPTAYGLGLSRGDDTAFPVVNVNDHLLPAVVLATICGHTAGTATYQLSDADLASAIALLEPAEACLDYDHPNLQAWRQLRQESGQLVAVFVGRLDDPVADRHDAAFRSRL
ncbi:MAG TPA: VOC family protein [Kribbella sp.]|nr:VOC family protein [Kribbella sp.]